MTNFRTIKKNGKSRAIPIGNSNKKAGRSIDMDPYDEMLRQEAQKEVLINNIPEDVKAKAIRTMLNPYLEGKTFRILYDKGTGEYRVECTPLNGNELLGEIDEMNNEDEVLELPFVNPYDIDDPEQFPLIDPDNEKEFRHALANELIDDDGYRKRYCPMPWDK